MGRHAVPLKEGERSFDVLGAALIVAALLAIALLWRTAAPSPDLIVGSWLHTTAAGH